jgi:hypothetical protein
MMRQLKATRPPEVTVRLALAPAQAAQVDFGAGPVLMPPDGRPRRTRAFVMTPVPQPPPVSSCGTRRWQLAGLPLARLRVVRCGARAGIEDNAKCAIVKACRHDPLVQGAYAECAEGLRLQD